jgi:tetratricopeptide (TPR) repeat protein
MRLALLLILFAVLEAQAAWLELRHGPFVVYTDAGPEPARLALNHLEQFRYAVGEAAGHPEPVLPWPVTVVVRKAGKGAPAPFIGFSRDGWILSWPAGSQPSPKVFRDFARIIIDANVPRPMPPGFEAALASLYSTLAVKGQRLTLGAPPPEPERSIEWATLHRLAITEESASRARVFFSNLANGAEEEIAWRNAFGPPPGGGSWTPKMRQAATAYRQAGQFTTRPAMGRLVPERELREIPALPSRIRLLPGDLALGRGAPPAEIRAAYEAALNEKPAPAGHEGRGLALLLEKRPEDARQELLAATAAEGAGPRAYYELARLEKDPARKLKLLEQAVRLNLQWADPFLALAALEPGPIRRAAHLKKAASLRPRDPQIWLDLAQAQFDAKQYADAEKSMRSALGAAPDEAAQAELTRRFEDFQQAKSDAEAAARKRERDEEKADLDRVRNEALARVHQAEQAANEKAGSVQAQKVENWWDGPPTKSLSVTLKQVDCLGRRARLVVDNAGQPLRLLIPDSGQILVLGPDGNPSPEKARLGCGPQRPPRRVKIEYTPRADAAAGTSGDAVSLQFLTASQP